MFEGEKAKRDFLRGKVNFVALIILLEKDYCGVMQRPSVIREAIADTPDARRRRPLHWAAEQGRQVGGIAKGM